MFLEKEVLINILLDEVALKIRRFLESLKNGKHFVINESPEIFPSSDDYIPFEPTGPRKVILTCIKKILGVYYFQIKENGFSIREMYSGLLTGSVRSKLALEFPAHLRTQI